MKSDSTPIISGNKRGREDGLDQLMQPAPDTYGIRTGQYAAKLSERIELAAAFDALQSSRGMSSPTQQLARLGVRGVHPATTDIQMLLIAAEARKDPKLQQLSGDPLGVPAHQRHAAAAQSQP